MAARKKTEEVEVLAEKDFAGAVKLFKNDIRPATSKQAEHAQEASTAYKAVKKNCHIQPDAAKKAFKLWFNTEDAKRDDWLRSFVGLINEAAGYEVLVFNDTDLVAQAEGKSRRPNLVPVGDDFEAPQSELDAQRDRPSVEAAQAEADAESEREAAE